MKPVRIFTPNLEFLTEIDDYESLIFTRRWHEVGEFELRINRHKNGTDALQKGNLVMLGADRHKVGIIKHREIELSEEGKASETWLIRGWTLQGVTKQRITVPPSGSAYDSITDVAETVMKHYIDAHIVNPTDTNRKIDILTIATDQGRGQSISWQSRFKLLDEELAKISKATGFGWNIYLDFDLLKWVFEVYEGRDLTSGQTTNPPVIFSPDFDALKTQHYAESDLSYRNYAYVGGQGEDIDRMIAETGTATGLDRIEVFIDARDLSTSTELQERGNQKLSELDTEKLLEAQILTEGPFAYEQDWDLGDIVTIQNKDWGVTMDARIIEVKEIYEPSGFRLEAIFGNSWPTLINRLKSEFEQMSAEVRR